MICSSWSWPNMFDVARGQVGLYTDVRSVVNRVKLLLLTEPTELYLTPNFGVGLKKYMFSYNNDNTIAMIKDALIAQLRIWEPSVIPEETTVTRGLDYTGSNDIVTAANIVNVLNLTITLKTRYGQTISFGVDEKDIDGLK